MASTTLHFGVLWVNESTVSYCSSLAISKGTLRSKSAKYLLGKTVTFDWDKTNRDCPGIIVFVGMYITKHSFVTVIVQSYGHADKDPKVAGAWVNSLSPQDVERLAEKHGLTSNLYDL